MTMSVFDLASIDTRLHRVAIHEYAGPCPGCGGDDRFHVNLRKRGGHGGFMCRYCWPAEEKGWGDEIDYLRHFKGMSFHAAKTHLGEAPQVNGLLSHVNTRYRATAGFKSESWQSLAREVADSACEQILTPEGQACLDYLHLRGFTDETIRKARLGFDTRWSPKAGQKVPCITIPWYADGKYWKITCRDIRMNCPPDHRYFSLSGSTNQGLYFGDVLKARRGFVAFLVEDEFSALAIAQEAGDLVNVVAISGADSECNNVWTMRLAAAEAVMLAFDADQAGRNAAQKWRRILSCNSRRYAPLCKDANDMLIKGWSVRTWTQGAIEHTVAEMKAARTPDPPENDDPLLLPTSCTICGSEDLWQFNEDGSQAWCLSCWQSLQEQQEKLAFTTQEHFLGYVSTLAQSLQQSTGVTWSVMPIPKEYALDKHVKFLQEQERAEIRRLSQRVHLKAREA